MERMAIRARSMIDPQVYTAALARALADQKEPGRAAP